MISGLVYNIIFSSDPSYRWKRHFLFWLAVFCYQFLRIGIMMPLSGWRSFFSFLELTVFWGLVMNMIFSYSVIYFLIPRYFKKRKYFVFALGFIILYLFIDLAGSMHVRLLAGQQLFRAIGYTEVTTLFDKAAVIRLFGNLPLICGLLLSLKTLKNWRLEQLRTDILAKENANAELQLLKAQIHPHFLFNTLNNIYSFSLYKSPQAGTLVNKLSGMLDYMIHECDEKMVALEKELMIIEDYMSLEKIRYGKRLDMQVEIHGDFENKFIAPLLMIPFVENCFKHGTSQMLQHPWIKLEITTMKDQLFFKLSNSKPSLFNPKEQDKGIGLVNVRKRLQLLYPRKYQLEITETEDTFTVSMQILLEEKNTISMNKIVDTKNTPVYA
jgi:hypothetical protein